MRILVVSAGLSVVGAIMGAIAATVALFVIVATTATAAHPGSTITPDMVLVAAGDGAVFGLVLGPLTAWLALRRVPLGWAMLSSTVATTVGAIAGSPLPFAGPVLGAMTGFLLSSLWLRRQASVPRLAKVTRASPSALATTQAPNRQ